MDCIVRLEDEEFEMLGDLVFEKKSTCTLLLFGAADSSWDVPRFLADDNPHPVTTVAPVCGRHKCNVASFRLQHVSSVVHNVGCDVQTQ
jgi:hypothetical protein